MQIENYIVYIKADESGRIIAVNSSAFLLDTAGWTEIDAGLGDKYHHAQGNYFPQPLYDEQGCHNYIYGGTVRPATLAEKAEELAARPKPEPTAEDDIMNMIVDQEYRLTLLELGVI